MAAALDHQHHRGGAPTGAAAGNNNNMGAAAAAALGTPATYAAQSQSWFLGAPATKLLSMFVVVAYIVVKTQRWKNSLMLLPNSQMVAAGTAGLYRYWTCQWTFGSTGELIMGTSLLALLARKFET